MAGELKEKGAKKAPMRFMSLALLETVLPKTNIEKNVFCVLTKTNIRTLPNIFARPTQKQHGQTKANIHKNDFTIKSRWQTMSYEGGEIIDEKLPVSPYIYWCPFHQADRPKLR